MKLGLELVQSVLFTPGLVMQNRLTLANKLMQTGGGTFDGDPSILPLPKDAPQEIPRMILQSKDASASLKVALNRTDLHLTGAKARYSDKAKPSVPLDLLVRTLQILKGEASGRVVRSALATFWSLELEKPAPDYICGNFLKPDTVPGGASEAEVHVLHKLSIAGFDSNRWMRIRSAHKTGNETANNFLLVQVDINTLAEKDLDLDEEALKLFFADAAQVTERSIVEYFRL